MNSTKKFITSLFILILVSTIISPLFVNAENNIKPNTWSYVDGLGRTESTFGEIPKAKDDHPRFVGIFYHTWHTEFSIGRIPVNMTQVVTDNPEAAVNVKKNVFWVKNFERYYSPGYFWNEPLLGYYSTVDEYVLRKHAELLADAGVDFIYIDGTNGRFLWEDGVNAILKVFSEARADGVKAPQIVFWLSLSDINNRIAQLRAIYDNWYSKSEYDDMWFKWEGKPLVLCSKDVLDFPFENSEEIINNFTFRSVNPSYFSQGST
ncbi:MAG: hypothetical protein II220_04365, partial [Spirochaetales bacterium]|nr:hypothetical protein [Spirochaetales bacterium]